MEEETKLTLSDLIEALPKCQLMIFDNYALKVNARNYFLRYAEKHEGNPDALTEEQRKMAFQEEVLRILTSNH